MARISAAQYDALRRINENGHAARISGRTVDSLRNRGFVTWIDSGTRTWALTDAGYQALRSF
jgi:hypothetical protein